MWLHSTSISQPGLPSTDTGQGYTDPTIPHVDGLATGRWPWLLRAFCITLFLFVQLQLKAQTFCAPDATAYYTFEQTFQDRSSYIDLAFPSDVEDISSTTSLPTFSNTAKVGVSSASFNGTTNFLRYDNSSGYMREGGHSLSFMFWFKANAPGSGTQVLFEQGDNTNGIGIRLNNTTGQLVARVRADGAITDLAGTNITDTQWHHVALTYYYSTTTATRLYLDGTLVDSELVSQPLGNSTNQGGIGASIGLSVWGGTAGVVSQHFNGYIDDFIYRSGLDGSFSQTDVTNYISCVNGYSTNKFDCNGSVYFGLGNLADGATDLKQYIYSSNSFLNIDPAGTMGYNGIGYNQLDNYIYGIRNGYGEDPVNRDGSLIRIGANGTIEDLGFVVGLPAKGYNSGDVSPTGIMYVTNSTEGVLYAIDLTVTSPYAATAVTITSPVYVGDWAINPADNHLYSVDLSGRIEKINPATGAVSIIVPANGFLPAGTYAGIWFDQYGNMYTYGGIIRYNFAANSWSNIGTAANQSGASYADVAVCPVVKSDPAIAKQLKSQTGNTATFDITLSNDGPSPAADVIARDVLNAGLVFQSIQVLNASEAALPSTDYSIIQTPAVGTNGTVQVKVNNLSVGATNNVILRLTVKAAAGVCNQTIPNCTEIISAFGVTFTNGNLTTPVDNLTAIPGDVASNNEACAPVSFSLTPAAPTATASASAVCSGQSFSITYTNIPADGTLLWTRMPDGSSGTGNVSQVLSNTTTAPISYTYTSLIQNLYNCPSPPTVTVVTVDPTPIIEASVCSQTICSGETGVISFSSSIGGTTINWLRVEDGLTGTGDISETFTTAGTYTYKIWGTSPPPASCPTSGTLTCVIEVKNTCCDLVASLGAIPTTNCDNVADGALEIEYTGSSTYQYNVNGGAFQPLTVSPFSVTGLAAGTYTVVVQSTTDPSCSTTLTGEIVTPTAPVVSTVVVTNPTTCTLNDGGLVVVLVNGSAGVFEYSINNGGSWQLSNTFSGLTAGNYTVLVRNAAAPTCFVNAGSFQIQTPGSVTATIDGENQDVCELNQCTITISAGGRHRCVRIQSERRIDLDGFDTEPADADESGPIELPGGGSRQGHSELPDAGIGESGYRGVSRAHSARTRSVRPDLLKVQYLLV
jgi:uncharacterized repeat protein (TIGR01451 family)